MHRLWRIGVEVHLYSVQITVVVGTVPELGDVEIGVQGIVDDLQDVEVKCRRHTRCIVVGSFQHSDVLHQVHSQQQAVAGGEHLPYLAEEF